MRMQTNAPARKVMASTVAAALVTVVIWLIKLALPDVTVPANVREALIVIATVVAVFLGGYFTPPASRDQVVNPAAGRPTPNPI